MLTIKNLKINAEKDIVNGVDLEINDGELHVVMGPNGSGKSTLALALMGHPKYNTTGEIIFNGTSIANLTPDKRAKLGMFLGFQYPKEIEGVSVSNFLRTSYKILRGDISLVDFDRFLTEKMKILKIDPSFKERYVNQGFSGGEKKRLEMLQLLVLEPKFAMLDEIDSGLDRDALEVVARSIEAMKDGKRSFLIITHYPRLLEFIIPDKIHVMKEGKIAKSGGKELAQKIEKEGYESIK